MPETKIGGERLQRIDHNQLLNKGVNTHSAIDSHIANVNNPHNVTHAQLPDKGTNTHLQIDAHISDTNNPHSVTHAQLPDKGTNTHTQIDSHIANTNNPHNVTATQVGKDTAQWNADRIKGKVVDDTAIGDTKTLTYDSVAGTIKYLSKVKIATGTYTGNGTSQSITCSFEGKNFQPKLIEIVDITGTVYRSIKIDTMNASDYMRTNPAILGGNAVTYVTSGQGITITSTGFSVGNEASINNNGDTYKWVAIG